MAAAITLLLRVHRSDERCGMQPESGCGGISSSARAALRFMMYLRARLCVRVRLRGISVRVRLGFLPGLAPGSPVVCVSGLSGECRA